MMTDGRSMRIAAYGRIPGHKDALFKQKAAMIQRFSEIIQQHGNWAYSGAFIDSGTSHDQLDVLLDHCREGAVDTIITASMNTLSMRREELYRTLSELKNLGVDIDFIDEGLSTSGEGGEELLSTLASFLKPVKPPKPVTVPYGIGDEDEAAVVERIFSLFLEGHGRTPIASALNADHIPPPITNIKKECAAWTYCDIRRILANPVYRDGGIITAEMWDAAFTEQTRRHGSYGRRPPAASPLRGIITCGVCGGSFYKTGTREVKSLAVQNVSTGQSGFLSVALHTGRQAFLHHQRGCGRSGGCGQHHRFPRWSPNHQHPYRRF